MYNAEIISFLMFKILFIVLLSNIIFILISQIYFLKKVPNVETSGSTYECMKKANLKR